MPRYCHHPAAPIEPDPTAARFYVRAMKILDEARLPYVVGGGYAMAHYSGIRRNTKDLDLFILPADRDRVLRTLADAGGYRTEYFYPFWISKAISGDAFIDILYNSGNGLCPVDRQWIDNAVESDVLGYRTKLCPAEEQLWSKSFVQDRDRFDGADVIHMILGWGDRMDWQRLLRRFEGHQRVLLAHLILFGYAYPSERDKVPDHVIERLLDAVRRQPADPAVRVCAGTNLAQHSYEMAVCEWGFADARLQPYGPLTREQLDQLRRQP